MSKVDLFIPTYNRPDFLRRLLNYYQDLKVKYRIIVADSSSDRNKKLNKKIIQEFSRLNIMYLDKFQSSQVSHQKFGEMIKAATAKYTVFCADDDFLIPSGIDDVVNFLEKNKDYSSAHGTYIAFYINENLPFFKKFIWRYIYPYESITDGDPLKRISKHLTNYYQVLWAVRRTDHLKSVYKDFLKSKTSPVLFGELLPDMLTLVYGKMKRLNTFYSARQAFSTAYGYWPSLQDAIRNGEYETEYDNFRKCIFKSLNKLTGNSKEEVNRAIDESMKKYLKHSEQEHITGQINLLLRKFPEFLANFIRQLHILYLYSKKNSDRIGYIDNPKSKYFNNFEILKKHIVNY